MKKILISIIVIVALLFLLNRSSYSEHLRLMNIGDKVEEESVNYINFFNHVSSLKNSVTWNLVDDKLNEVDYSEGMSSSIQFSLYSNEIGYVVSGISGMSISLSDSLASIKNRIIFKYIEDETGLNDIHLDSIRIMLEKIDEDCFRLYKDGTVAISRKVGSDLFDMDEYEIVYVGNRVFLYGNYRNLLLGNIYVGKKNN